MFARLAAALVGAALGLTAGVPAGAAQNFRISSGTSTGDFLGEAIGVDFVSSRLVTAWPDNSAELGGNPDRPSLDIAFAGVAGGVVGPNVNVTRAPLSQFGTSVAVDPTDPDTIVLASLGGASSDSRPAALRAFSRDGGATWTVVGGLPGNFGGFPPSVAFDAFGNCFLALIHDPDFGNPRLELLVSTDGGATFAPVVLPALPGLETNVSVAAGFGAVWLAFEAYDGTARIQTLAASVTASGEVDAFTRQALPGSAEGRRPDIALRPGGAAVVAYGHGAFTETPTVSIQVDGDGLGAAGFGPRVPVANVPGYPNLPRPKLGVDGSSGRIHLVYPDRQQGAGPEEIRLNFSDDGNDWSAAITVNDPVASFNRKLPDIAVDGGTVGVAWFDSRNGGAQLWGDLRSGVTRPAEPRAPLNLLATGVSQSQIDLSWTDTSDNEQGFQIQRSDGNPFVQPPIVATLPANTTSWSDEARRGGDAGALMGRNVEVVEGGIQTTVQDYPGRRGMLAQGFFPAGPMDHLALRAANLLAGNDESAAGLEVTLGNLALRLDGEATVAVCGADTEVTVDGEAVPLWESRRLPAGSELRIGVCQGPGFRQYVAFSGGVDVPPLFGSRATYTMGALGGLEGRALKAGDVVPLGSDGDGNALRFKESARPTYAREWQIEAMRGPQAAPDYLTEEDMETFFGRTWAVDRNSNRTGIRLESHLFQWARSSGGVAGGHPSNILDNSYPVGAVNINGDLPVILGPDGPTAGGFVCAATVIHAGFWKIGQLRPVGDTVRFREVTEEEAAELDRDLGERLSEASLEDA